LLFSGLARTFDCPDEREREREREGEKRKDRRGYFSNVWTEEERERKETVGRDS
jgi:hypothetical protein